MVLDKDRFISASAGTGKTHAISTTYVDIFDQANKSKDPLHVGNVVAITFTRKAASEMKSRIIDMINERAELYPGWQDLHSSMVFSWISTMDSFARRILTEVGLFAGVDPDLDIGADPRVQSIVQRSISQTLHDNQDLLEPLLKLYSLNDINKTLSDALLSKRYSIIRSEIVTANESKLPLHNDPAMAEDIIAASSVFKKLFNHAHEDFQSEINRENITDFTGILTTLCKILSSERYSWVRERYRKQFKYIIVDEFQDTDSLQKRIVDLLRSEENHIVYVGDAKQSIYRFRGAEVEVFAEAREDVHTRDGEIEHLKTNYRSHPDILKFCNAFYPKIFSNSDKPYSQTYESVKPLSVEGETCWNPRVKLLFDPEDEADAAARYILSIVGNDFDFLERDKGLDGSVVLKVKKRQIRFQDIAILLRKMRPNRGKEYMKAFARYNIPYYTVGESGFFEMPEISGVLSLLKVITNPRDDLSMTSALLSPVVGLDVDDVARLKHKSKGAGESIYESFDLLDGAEFSGAKAERLRRFREALLRYIPIRTMIKPSELVERIIEDLDYDSYLATEDPTGRKTANLRKLVVHARNLDSNGLSLRELVRMLSRVGLDDEEQASIESEETDAVKIMTVHKAKGLEFPIVIVADTSWGIKKSMDSLLFQRVGRKLRYTLYSKEIEPEEDCILSQLVKEELERKFEEDKRSLYVATTRASDMLVLTFSGNKRNYLQPWREMLLENLLIPQEDGIELAPEFDDIVEIVYPPQTEPFQYEGDTEVKRFSARYMAPVELEAFKEYVSPTALIKAGDPFWMAQSAKLEPEIMEDEKVSVLEDYSVSFLEDGVVSFLEDSTVSFAENQKRSPSKGLGRLAHRIMELVGIDGARLSDMGSYENPMVPVFLGSARFSESNIKEVWKYLDRLKEHPLLAEIENALDVRSEYKINKPFGKYMLYGRPDKLIRTPEGWTIVDFKFMGSDLHNDSYEFQMKFYIYIARELFCPLVGASLFYLLDGGVKDISLDDDEIKKFEEDLGGMIRDFQEGIVDGHKKRMEGAHGQ